MKCFKDKNYIIIKCPGCEEYHCLTINSPNHSNWNFNGNFELPTFTPSLLVTTGKYVVPNYKDLYPEDEWEWFEKSSIRCHSFITDGKIQFLSDCTHKLVNQTVDLPEANGFTS